MENDTEKNILILLLDLDNETSFNIFNKEKDV